MAFVIKGTEFCNFHSVQFVRTVHAYIIMSIPSHINS